MNDSIKQGDDRWLVDAEYFQEQDVWEFIRQYGEFRRVQALAEVRFWERVLRMEPTKTARELRKERHMEIENEAE